MNTFSKTIASVAIGVLFLGTACATADVAGESAEDPTPATASEQDGAASSEPSEPNTPDGALADFEGQDLTFIVPYSAGGGYDTMARALVPYLEEYLQADVLVENMTGAGGLVAMNHLQTIEPDGFTFATMSGPGLAGSVIAEVDGAQFGLTDFSYIGRTQAEPRVWFVGSDVPTDDVSALVDAESFTFGASGAGASDHLDASVLDQLFGLGGNIVTGYGGTGEIVIAVASGEVQGFSNVYPAVSSNVADGDIKVGLVLSDTPHPEAPDAPLLLGDVDLDDDQRALAEAHVAMQAFGRPLLTSPGVPEDRLAVLRDAFEHALTSDGYLAEMETAGLPVHYLSGDEMAGLAASLADAPEPYVQLLKAALNS